MIERILSGAVLSKYLRVMIGDLPALVADRDLSLRSRFQKIFPPFSVPPCLRGEILS
jgi:hypothetical protein